MSSFSLSFPANTAAGDLILVAFDYDTNSVPSSVTDSQGNLFTPIGNQLTSSGGTRSRVYYAMNIKGGADTVKITLSGTSAYLELYLTEYTGVNLTNPIDAQAGASGAAGAVSSGTATTTMAGDTIYAFCMGDWNCKTGSGFNARSTFNANLIEDELAGNAGGYAATGTANNGWTIQMVALKPATSTAGAAPAITSATTASGTVGIASSYQITASNSPTKYGATGLPAGLSINTTSGLISGTPTTAGTSTVTLSASNATGTGSASLTFTVNLAAPVITSLATASGTVGIAFSYQITATNTPASYAAKGLPAGLSVNTGTGLISGTPTTAGTSTITLSATNNTGTGNASLALTITVTAPTITSATTATGTVGAGFSYHITATNSPTSYSASGLPSGLSVNTTSGLISGTPTSAGTSTATVAATNASGTGSASLTLSISAAAPVITGATTASGTVGNAFSYQIAATNSPTSFGATGLPSGLSVNTSSGLISGAPSTAGTSTVTLTASNSAGNGSAILTLTISSSGKVSPVQVAANAASGSTSSFSLPFLANTIAGDVILVAFDYDTNSVPSSVTDSQGNLFTPIGNQLASPGGTRSRVYYAMNIKGGADTVKITLSGTSAWLELYLTEYTGVNQTNPIDAQAGSSGTAGAVSSGNATTTMAGDAIYGFCMGDWNCTAGSGFSAHSNFNGNLVENELAGNASSYAATGTANKGWTMQMAALKPASSGVGVAAPAITSATTASGSLGTAFSYQITATNSPTSYGATGLPAGLSVNAGTGLISGTPTGAGTSTISLSATNAGGTGPATLTLTVNAALAPVITSATTTSGTVGITFSYQITATNSPTSYGATGLPAGLSVNTGTGLVSGTPTAAGTSTISLSATNAGGTGPATLILTVSGGGVAQGQLLTLSANGRYLINSFTGKPVFVVGDDAFDLAVMLNSAQVATYLNDRSSRGFNAIWVTAADNGYQPN
ncbi:MAG: putative Ig domain-containing protein, partial [Candidatus Acidiferrales bacterium]